MHLVSWNVNGLRAAAKKGFLTWLEETDADVVFLQETKALPEQLDEEIKAPYGWAAAFHSAERKGYSGVAVYWRTDNPPDEVVLGLGVERFDAEGRAIMARWGDLAIWGNYFPNGGQGPERVAYKLDFYATMLERMNAQREAGLGVVVTGDYNTAHQEWDLARPDANHKTSGFLPEERAWVDRYVEEGWVDTYRRVKPDERDVYTWWSFRGGARARNVGWRIDYFFVDAATAERVTDFEVEADNLTSDHAPIHLFLDE